MLQTTSFGSYALSGARGLRLRYSLAADSLDGLYVWGCRREQHLFDFSLQRGTEAFPLCGDLTDEPDPWRTSLQSN